MNFDHCYPARVDQMGALRHHRHNEIAQSIVAIYLFVLHYKLFSCTAANAIRCDAEFLQVDFSVDRAGSSKLDSLIVEEL